MRRRWKTLIGVLAALAVLLGLNTIALDQETKSAEVTVPGGKILSLNGGDLEVLDVPPTAALPKPPGSLPGTSSESLPGTSSASPPGGPGLRAGSDPIVLLHCYTCGINWWDGLIPLLSRERRVIAIDLLGHDGSEKPASGYSMPDQADLVAQALDRLGVRGATLVGHSTGGTVATALAAQSPGLVSRLVILDQAPDNSFGGLDLLARITYWPVVGEALWRISPDAAIKDGLSQAFAPGFDVPDRFVDDFRRMTYTSYDSTSLLEDNYLDQEPLNRRIASFGIPLLVIFGAEDQIYDSREAISAYAGIRGARTALIRGAGHSPYVEKPARVAKLILGFARPEFEPKPRSGRVAVRSTTAGCQSAIIGSGRPGYRSQSTVAGPLALFGAGRDFSRSNRVGPGTFETKIPAIVAGKKRTVLLVPADERDQVGLIWGHEAGKLSPNRVRDGFGRVTFVPCTDKPRTVWPGGLLMADRNPVRLVVIYGKRRYKLRVG